MRDEQGKLKCVWSTDNDGSWINPDSFTSLRHDKDVNIPKHAPGTSKYDRI